MDHKEFREGNAEVVELVRETIEPLAVKRYNHALYPHSPEHLSMRWSGGYMAWYISYPKHFAEIFGPTAVANAHETCAEVVLDGKISLLIGPNGAWERSRTEQGRVVGDAYRADAQLVKSILGLAFDALARDLAKRSLAGVAIELREKSVGFGKFNRIVDIAKEILGRK